MNKRFTFKSSQCTGCRSCELACSFHHKEVFNPSISSIKINRTIDGFEISIYGVGKDSHLGCDLCKGVNGERQCVKACSPLFREELKKFFEKIANDSTRQHK